MSLMSYSASRVEQIEEVFAFFNFAKVHSVMTHLKWEWSFPSEGLKRVPTEFELNALAMRLLNEVKFGEAVETGGFRADYRDGALSLEFLVEHWTSH